MTTFDRKKFLSTIIDVGEIIDDLEGQLTSLDKQDATIRDALTLIQSARDRLYSLKNICYGIEITKHDNKNDSA